MVARITPIVAVFVVAGAWLGAADAAEPLAADKISAAVAKRYNVTVLRATPTTIDDRPAYVLAVMNPGGDDNGAFKVTVLIVDAETGVLVPQFMHRAAGYDLPSPSDRSPRDDASGPMIRSLTEREYRQR
jgi:hypothetical protein